MIEPHKTAISRKKPSRPTIDNLECGRLYGRVLDYGCGKGQDMVAVSADGFMVDGYDPYYRKTELKPRSYDTIYCNFVLNVIATHSGRVGVIEEMFKLLNEGGTIIIAVRNKKDIEASKTDKWKPQSGGYITTKNTFQIGIDVQELVEIFEDCIYSDQAELSVIEMSKYTAVTLTCNLKQHLLK